MIVQVPARAAKGTSPPAHLIRQVARKSSCTECSRRLSLVGHSAMELQEESFWAVAYKVCYGSKADVSLITANAGCANS